MDKLQELTQKLYEEGLSKGKQEGEAILSKAKADAEAIVKKATEEAEAILAKARKEADDLRVRVEGDVKTASAQALQATKADIESLIVAKAVEPAGAALKEPDFLKRSLRLQSASAQRSPRTSH